MIPMKPKAKPAPYPPPVLLGPEACRLVAAAIRHVARTVPLGGSIRIRGSLPISSFNFAEECARIVEDLGAGRDVYRRICDQPAKAPGAQE